MKRKIIISAAVVLLVFFSIFCFLRHYYSVHGNKIKAIAIDGAELKVEIAATPAKRNLGLGGRSGLFASCGMLFEFPEEGVYPFWMKDMKFNLDMLWIAGDTIVEIKKNIPYSDGIGKTFVPTVLADKVLEINAGLSDKLGFKVGDKVGF